MESPGDSSRNQRSLAADAIGASALETWVVSGNRDVSTLACRSSRASHALAKATQTGRKQNTMRRRIDIGSLVSRTCRGYRVDVRGMTRATGRPVDPAIVGDDAHAPGCHAARREPLVFLITSVRAPSGRSGSVRRGPDPPLLSCNVVSYSVSLRSHRRDLLPCYGVCQRGLGGYSRFGEGFFPGGARRGSGRHRR